MKQIIQDFKKGTTTLEEVPAPIVKPGTVLIKTSRSLISLGTERMLVDFGKANILNKARQQPEKVKMVKDKIKSDGLKPTYKAVFSKLEQPVPLGYCNVGIVVAVGENVSEYKIGDRVASNGYHAEYVCVPKNLVSRIPDNVTDEEAAFTVVGAIGLQGIRLLNPTFGETIVVVGLGLIGLITAEILLANGCKVIGFDINPKKIAIAKEMGITAVNVGDGTDPVKFVARYSRDVGVDGIIITASHKSDEIISQAAQMCRKRGRIVLIGVIGLNIKRADFYEKEITFQVSCSYGPGRYDDNYEIKGQDYPLSYVRWTEKRNFEAVLDAISKKSLNVKPLISDRVSLQDYNQIYGNMDDPDTIASILIYDDTADQTSLVSIRERSFEGRKGVIGIIGAGNFTRSTLLPILKKTNSNIKYIASSEGLSSTILAKKYNISNSTSDYREILKDKEVDLVFITTRHDMHAPIILEAMKAGKNIFVEKPLVIKNSELDKIIAAYSEYDVNISVGFNRRFAPLAKKIKVLLGSGETPINIITTINAGAIPSDNWVHDIEVGGGRIIGEVCHFIDICSYFSGSKVISVCANTMGTVPKENTDNVSILVKYKNGSNAVINFFSNGSKAYSKERIEIFSQDRTLIVDNWRKLYGYGFKGFSKSRLKQDKGHLNQFQKIIEQQKMGGGAIISFEEIVNTTKATFAAVESLKTGDWVFINKNIH